MARRNQEFKAVELFIETMRAEHGIEFEIHRSNAEDFPDFVLRDQTRNDEKWVEVVEAVESGEIIASERLAQRLYDAAAQEYRAGGEEVVLEVSPQGVQRVTPSPGYGVTGMVIPGPFRKVDVSGWITKALAQKGDPNRYGAAERAKTTLLIDCSREVVIEKEDVAEVRSGLAGNTLGFKEVWCVSTNWARPRALILAP